MATAAGGALDARNQSQRLGGGAIGHGGMPAAIVVAAILQRGAAITSAGGYLRELTRKAEVGEFTLGPMLMALIGRRKREKRRA